MADHCSTCDAPLITGNECVVALTLDELQAVIELLRIDHRHGDFEPECPGCTAAQKLGAARSAAHGVIVGGESNTDDVPERLKGDALRSSREAGCKQKGPVARAADTGSFVGSNPTVVHSVDWLGLALDLEAQAKRVESQTAERAMLAGAHGLRLMGAAGVTACHLPGCPHGAECVHAKPAGARQKDQQ